MDTKKSPAGRQGQAEIQCKDKYSSRTIIVIRQIFLSGRSITAKGLNNEIGTNDARKYISQLRREGMNIQDIRMGNRCKLYWLEKEPATKPV